MRDSRTGYFIPVRYGLGLLPDGRVVGAPSPSSPSASPGNHLEKVTLTVLVFGPEWVSYERSRRMRHANRREISARVFFVKIPQSQNSMIYTILRFFGFWVLGLGFGIGFWDWVMGLGYGIGIGFWVLGLGLGYMGYRFGIGFYGI